MTPYINPEHVWKPGQVFVFGSNLRGIHGGGAARFARLNCGAEMGVGEGRTGMAYAIPTKADPYTTLPLHDIKEAAAAFFKYVREHQDETFFLTRIGCGLAGYTDEEIAPLFYRIWIPQLKKIDGKWYVGWSGCNVIYPPEWTAIYDAKWKRDQAEFKEQMLGPPYMTGPKSIQYDLFASE